MEIHFSDIYKIIHQKNYSSESVSSDVMSLQLSTFVILQGDGLEYEALTSKILLLEDEVEFLRRVVTIAKGFKG